MKLDSFEAVFLAIAFLVPGFVWSSVLSMLIPRRTQALQVRMLEFLTLSCFNYAIWSWLIFLVFKRSWDETHPVWAAGAFFFILFASPTLLGLCFARLRQRNKIAWFLVRFGFRTVACIPTAWDWHFRRQKPYWVIVRLSDGSRVAGYFGYNSFAGDDPQERDLYLEKVCRPAADKGSWEVVPDTGGVLLKAREVVAVEFKKVKGFDYEG